MTDQARVADRDMRVRWGSEVSTVSRDGGGFRCYTERSTTVPEVLTLAERWMDRDYLVQGERRLTYRDALHAIGAARAELYAAGVTRGDRVLLIGWSGIDWVVAFWAVLSAGALPVLGNRWWSPVQSKEAARLVDAAAVIADESVLAALGHPCSLDLRLTACSERAPADMSSTGDEDTAAMILFTSGSTGVPKGAVLAHRSLLAMTHGLLHVTRRLPHEIADDHDAGADLISGPLFHIGGIQLLLTITSTGGTAVFPRGRFDPKEILDVIERERIRRWGGVPTIVRRVMEEPDFASRDMSSLQSVGLGGAPVTAEFAQQVRAAFPGAGGRMVQQYGLSEACGAVTLAGAQDLERKPGTVGRPLPLIELSILDPSADGTGEIAVRSPTTMLGYLPDSADAEIEDRLFTPDGWLLTGDLGYLDDDGYLFVTGRRKDVIIRGGENIVAPRVESVLLQHPAVLEAAVVGLPDDDLGQVVGACVVVDDPSVESDTLAAHVWPALAHYETPSRWWVRREHLPLTASLKVDKPRLLKEWPAHEARQVLRHV